MTFSASIRYAILRTVSETSCVLPIESNNNMIIFDNIHCQKQLRTALKEIENLNLKNVMANIFNYYTISWNKPYPHSALSWTKTSKKITYVGLYSFYEQGCTLQARPNKSFAEYDVNRRMYSFIFFFLILIKMTIDWVWSHFVFFINKLLYLALIQNLY